MLEKYSGTKPYINSMNYGLFDAIGGIIGSMFNYGATQATNVSNQKINDDNIKMQREFNKSEEERYQEALEYNRAFAEDQRDYERQLQQIIFDREDTAIERQAQSLSNLGINPASVNMNGLNAGQAVTPTSAPTVPNYGGSAPHADKAMISPNIDLRLGDILSDVNMLDELNTRGIQRDLLRQQESAQRLDNQAKEIENIIKMDKYDISVDDEGNLILNKKYKYKDQDISNLEGRDKTSSTERNERENQHQQNYGTHDNSSTRSNDIADVARQMDRAVTGAQQLAENASNSSKQAGELIKESAKKKMSAAKEWINNGWEQDKKNFSKIKNKFSNWYDKYFKGSAENNYR